MSVNSAREWRIYILTRGVFGNALKFAHLQTTGEVARTPPATTANIAGAGGDAIPVDDYCALPTRITGEIEDDVDLE